DRLYHATPQRRSSPKNWRLTTVRGCFPQHRCVIMTVVVVLISSISLSAVDRDWPAYLGDAASTHYSTLEQSTPRNVQRVSGACTFNSGECRKDNRSQIQCNPLIVDGVLYGTTPQLK